jgi:hypothetical protein
MSPSVVRLFGVLSIFGGTPACAKAAWSRPQRNIRRGNRQSLTNQRIPKPSDVLDEGSGRVQGWDESYIQIVGYDIHQLGVATPDFRVRPSKDLVDFGVGDDAESWIVDLSRQCTYHGVDQDPIEFGGGVQWKADDIIGFEFGVDLNEATGKAQMRVWANGVDLGVAFHDIKCDRGLFPAMSVDGPGAVHFLVDPKDFGSCKLPPGYKPLITPTLDTAKQIEDWTRPMSVRSTQSREKIGSPSTGWLSIGEWRPTSTSPGPLAQREKLVHALL